MPDAAKPAAGQDDIRLGDVVRTRKAHPCGGDTWTVIRTGADIHSTSKVVEKTRDRVMVADTDTGAQLKKRVEELEELLVAYRSGQIVER